MASQLIPDTLRRVQAAMTPGSTDKVANMARDTISPSSQDRLTTDFGVRQANNDDWLKVVSKDKTGPALLEDTFGREKASTPSHCLPA